MVVFVTEIPDFVMLSWRTFVKLCGFDERWWRMFTTSVTIKRWHPWSSFRRKLKTDGKFCREVLWPLEINIYILARFSLFPRRRIMLFWIHHWLNLNLLSILLNMVLAVLQEIPGADIRLQKVSFLLSGFVTFLILSGKCLSSKSFWTNCTIMYS
jgi:hypothetical protein